MVLGFLAELLLLGDYRVKCSGTGVQLLNTKRQSTYCPHSTLRQLCRFKKSFQKAFDKVSKGTIVNSIPNYYFITLTAELKLETSGKVEIAKYGRTQVDI